MKSMIVANSMADDKDDLILAKYQGENGVVITSNVGVGIHSPFTGKLMKRIDEQTVTASLDEVTSQLVQVCACSNCGDTINVDPVTGQKIIAALAIEPAQMHCVSCGTLNTVKGEDVGITVKANGDDEDENDDDGDEEDGDDDTDEVPGNDDNDEEDELPDEDEPETNNEGDDEGSDEEDEGDDDEDEGADIEAALGLEEEPEFDEARVTASVQRERTPVMASVNLADNVSTLKVSAFECLASSESPIFAVKTIGEGKAMVFNVTASGAFVPLMELNAADAVASNKMLFDRPQLLESAFQTVVATEGFEFNVANLASFGARDITYNIPVSNVVKQRIDNGIKAVTAGFDDQKNNMLDDVRQCLSIASIEMVKGLRSNMPNPLREDILAAAQQLGIKDAEDVVDGAFESSSEPVCASLIERTLELLAKPLETRNELSKMVSDANYRSTQGNVAARVNRSLASGNVHFTPSNGGVTTTETVTASSRYSPEYTGTRAPENAGKFAHLFAR